jgi:hypothetical protein
MRSRLAPPHTNYSIPASSLDAPTFAGAGAGLRSTANDMLKFLAANIGLTEMELPRSGKGIHSHNGKNPGYHSYLAWDPERKIEVVVLTNAAIRIEDVGLQLMRGLPKPVLVDPQVLAEYAGRYQSPEGVIVTIRVDDTRIFVQVPNQGEYELVARSNNQFYPRAFYAETTFYKNASGEVDRMIYVLDGATTEAKKVP